MKTEIIVLVKDEQEYLEQWIQYHLALGFDRICIFEDYGSTSHQNIASKYKEVALAKLEDVRPWCGNETNSRRYGELLNKCLIDDVDEYDWALCIDVDEYLVLNGIGLHEFLAGFNTYPGVYLYWKYMSANGHVHKCSNIVQSYTKESTFNKDYVNQFKCFFNLHRSFLCDNYCHHRARYGVDTSKSLVHPQRIKQKKHFDIAWINHYYTRSWEDWCNRIYSKGNLTHGIRRLMHFFYYNEDMLCMKDQLVKPLFGRRPRCTIWLDSDSMLLYTGRTVDRSTAKVLDVMVQQEGIEKTQDYIDKNFSSN